jgi:hypothetical protein
LGIDQKRLPRLKFLRDPWKDLVPFHEYFHAETGKGLGASHQTGWTSLVAPVLEIAVKARIDGRTRSPRSAA